jgi:hypothetical protein
VRVVLVSCRAGTSEAGAREPNLRSRTVEACSPYPFEMRIRAVLDVAQFGCSICHDPPSLVENIYFRQGTAYSRGRSRPQETGG